MSTYTLNCLGHFQCGYDLNAICYRCDHVARLDLPTLAAEHGVELNMDAYAERLRCSSCGARQCGIMKIWHGGRDFSRIWL